MNLELDQSRCVRCGRCIQVCSPALFERQEDKTVRFLKEDAARCIKCGHCIAVCPKAAIRPNGFPVDTLTPVTKAPLSDEQRTMLFKGHRSTRVYKKDPIPRDVLNAVFEDANNAPSAFNLRPVRWTVVEGVEKIDAISDAVAAWMHTLGGELKIVAQNYDRGIDRILRHAPCAIFAHADPKSFMACTSCSVAAAFLDLSLHSRGIGSCWAGFVVDAAQAGVKLPGVPIPENHQVYAVLMAGYRPFEYARLTPHAPAPVTYA